MERAYARLRSLLDRIVSLQCGVAVVLFGLTGILMATEIVARKGLNLPVIWAEDLTVFMFVWTAFLGAAVLYDRKEALSIDSLVRHLSPRTQKYLGIAVDLLLFVALLYLAWLSYKFLVIQKGLGHKLGGATGIPSYVMTLSVLICFTTMFVSTALSLMKYFVPDDARK